MNVKDANDIINKDTIGNPEIFGRVSSFSSSLSGIISFSLSLVSFSKGISTKIETQLEISDTPLKLAVFTT